MTSFRTTEPPPRSPFAIGHADRVMCIGSCFTEHIGERLLAAKFRALLNPFGIVYNPVSMARCLDMLLAGPVFREDDLFENAQLWHSWEHHGHFSGAEKRATLDNINAAARRAADFLKTTNRLLLTFGTATVYSRRDTGRIVANCHKMPAAFFEKRRLSVAEIVAPLREVLTTLKSKNPDLQVVLTVSPVRHLRDGFVENQRSKAALLLACAEICEALPFAFYFPAYEWVLDDLRDYRFFKADMIHPNEQAIAYVWDCFGATFFSPDTKGLLARLDKIAAAAQHRPFRPDGEPHRAFCRAQLGAIAALEAAFPGLDFSVEKARFGLGDA